MSKRGAGNFGGDEERYGAYEGASNMDTNDKPMQATAAQMARRNYNSRRDQELISHFELRQGAMPRDYLNTGWMQAYADRIAATRKAGVSRSRGASPAIPANSQPGFGANQQQQFAVPTNSFTFGQQNGTGNNPFQGMSFGASPAPPAQPLQFGASTPAPSAQPQQNGTSNMFGGQSATPSFSSTFGSGSMQPQQNGFGQSTSSFFDKPAPSPTNTNGMFGASQQTPQNGTTPATSFGLGQSQQQSTQNGTEPFKFGASQQQKQDPKPIFGGSTTQTPLENGDKPAAANPFSGFKFGQTQPESSDKPSTLFGGGFGAKAHENGTKTGIFGGDLGQRQPDAVVKPSTPFDASPAQKPPEDGQQPGIILGGGIGKKQDNIFGNSTNSTLGSKQPETVSTPSASIGLFGRKSLFAPQDGEKTSTGDQTSKPSFLGFGQTQTASTQPEQQTPKPSTSLFSQPAQTNGAGKGLFGASLTPAATSQGSGSLFSNLPKKNDSFKFDSNDPSQLYRPEDDEDENDNAAADSSSTNAPQQQASKSATSIFGGFQPSISQQDTSMTTPGNTPQKSILGQTSAAEAPPTSTPATSQTAAAPRSLFDRIDKDDSKKLGLATPADKPSEAPKSFFGMTPSAPSTAKPLFAPSTTSAFGASASQAAESQTPKYPPPRSLFDRPASQLPVAGPFTPAPPAAPAIMFKAPGTAPPARISAAPAQPASGSIASQPQAQASTVALTAEQKGRLKELNEGFLNHLKRQDTEQDWTPILQYYTATSTQIRGVSPSSQPIAAAPAQAGSASAPSAPAATSESSISLFSAAPAKAPSSNVSGSQTPASSATPSQPAASGNIFSQATKPSSSSHSGAQTPMPAAGASFFSKPPSATPQAAQKKRPFEEDDDEPAQTPATEKRAKPNEQTSYPKLPDTASSTAKLFEAALDKPKAKETSNPTPLSGFNPSTKALFSTSTSQGTTPSTASFAPKATGGFTPSFAPPATGSFLSSFGSKAKEQDDKDRNKRKAEDYDSDEETEEQWEKRDREAQEAKRKSIEDAAKQAKGFVPPGSTAAAVAAAPDAATAEKLQGTGNNTWQPETPIKFGASTANTTSMTPAVPPPKLGGGLFGSAAPATTNTLTSEAGKLAPPTGFGFNFGPKPTSLDASRATTPCVTTDGEASTAAEGDGKDDSGESSEEQNAPQAEDLTALMPEEREANEVLLELPKANTKKHEKAEGDDKPRWVGKGDGRLYVLKDKATGKTRILQKVGLSQLALNFGPVKGMKYQLHPKKETMVIATFMDHIHCKPPKLDRFYITTETSDEAKVLARVLTEGTPQ